MAKKAKTHSGAKKTFKVTNTGKLIFDKSGNNHLLTNKGKSNKKSPYGKVVAKNRVKTIKKILAH